MAWANCQRWLLNAHLEGDGGSQQRQLQFLLLNNWFDGHYKTFRHDTTDNRRRQDNDKRQDRHKRQDNYKRQDGYKRQDIDKLTWGVSKELCLFNKFIHVVVQLCVSLSFVFVQTAITYCYNVKSTVTVKIITTTCYNPGIYFYLFI